MTQVVLHTSEGDIALALDAGNSPATVENFLQYVRDGHYDNTLFHRVIPGFMIQGGDPLGVGTGGPGYEFANEIDRSLKMDPGALAMANAGPDTNGSQFFIMEGSKPGLVGGYSIFGQCKDVDVVKAITHVPRDDNDKPNSPVTIKHVTISKG